MNNLARRGFIFGSATVVSYGLLVGVQRVCFSAFANDQADNDSRGPVTIVQFADDGTRLGAKSVAKLHRTNQEWKIVNRGNGQFTIKCIMSGLYLDAANNCVNSNGCAVQLWENYTQATQKWKFVHVN